MRTIQAPNEAANSNITPDEMTASVSQPICRATKAATMLTPKPSHSQKEARLALTKMGEITVLGIFKV